MRFEDDTAGRRVDHRLEPHVDERGFFARTFCERVRRARTADDVPPVEPVSNTHAGTLRGMHFNTTPAAEAKLVRCVRGAIHDVIVDLRADSPTYRQWFGVELNADNGRALFVPEGFAHGFLTLADDTDVDYQMGAFYAPDAARGVRWDDPAFGVEWPRQPVVISPRDADAIPTSIRRCSMSDDRPRQQAVADEMMALVKELYPICRSITGDGVRETLEMIGRIVPLDVSEVPSGTQVLDWTVPDEWNIRDAYVADASGRRVVDFPHRNLHVVSYACRSPRG